MATTQGSFRELCLGFSVLFFLLVSSIGSLSMFACCWLLLLLLLSLPCPALDRTLFDRNCYRFSALPPWCNCSLLCASPRQCGPCSDPRISFSQLCSAGADTWRKNAPSKAVRYTMTSHSSAAESGGKQRQQGRQQQHLSGARPHPPGAQEALQTGAGPGDQWLGRNRTKTVTVPSLWHTVPNAAHFAMCLKPLMFTLHRAQLSRLNICPGVPGPGPRPATASVLHT